MKCVPKSNNTLQNIAVLVKKGIIFSYVHGNIRFKGLEVTPSQIIGDDLSIIYVLDKVYRAFRYDGPKSLGELAEAKWVSFFFSRDGSYMSIESHHVVYLGQVYVEGVGVVPIQEFEAKYELVTS